MKSILTVFCCFLLAFTLSAQTSILHEPALSPDGSQIAFSYQGDIWSVSVTGGAANRLTVHESYESDPIWSPDGRNIAFVGNRFGNNDIFLTTTAAGTPQRLTEHSASDYSPRWMGNDAVFFSTNRIFAQVERNAETYQAKLNGGTPVRVMDAVGNEATPSPDGRYVAFVRGSCRVTREAYRGPANRDIWVYDKQVKTYTQITTDEGQDYHPLWTKDGKLTFLSARDGRYNLYQTSPTAGASKTQLTKFKDWGIRSYSTSADGQTIAIEQGAAILVSKNGGKKFNEVNISVGRDFKFYPVEERTLTVGISNFDISPNGKYLSMVARGEVFVKPNDKDKTRSRNVSNHPYNEESSAWLNDSLLLFISDRANNKPSLLLCQSQENEPANLYQSFQFDNTEVLNLPEGVSGFELSPQRDKIAVVEGRGNLYVYDIDSTGRLSNQTIMIDGWDNPGGLAWSPDGKWLAYSLSDLNFNQEVYIHAADNSSKPVNVSMHPRGDRSPVWSPDGSKLGFVSIRNNGNNDIWFVWLREDDYEKTQRDWEEADEWETVDQEKKKKGKKGEVEPIVIDFEDIHERLVQVTSLPGNEGSPVIGPKGEMFYFTTNNGSRAGREGSSDLMMIKWDGTEMKPLLSNVRVGGLQLGPANKKLYMNLRGKVAATPLDKGRAESQSFQAKMTLDHVAERTQMLEDGWRALNAGFYDPNFHGQDFAQLKEKYRPLMLGASTRQDFATLYNEMLGQLNASHMGFSSGTMDEDLQRDRTGMLGLEFDENQRISFILADGPADRKDSKLQIGDRITAINGAPVGASDNIYSHLNGRANERIQLTIDRNGATQKVLIRPVSSTSTLDYEAWVTLQKNLTERYSNGRLGYIHIRGMNWPSFERFERELTAAGLGKEGIVIDVRFNGGGWTTDMLMAVLNVRQHAYTVPRGAAKSLKENKKFLGNYPYGERLPLAAMTLPSVALCNETSYSNAEIFGHAYKHLGHGTLVGQPTFGAVISTGSHRLIDGSRVRMPFRAWYVHATQENMEGGPAVPDVLVKSPPGEKANNEDAQLKKAVEVLLGQIK